MTIAGWVRDWLPDALAAAAALAPVGEAVGRRRRRAAERIRGYAGELLDDAGLPECCELVGHEPLAPPSESPTVPAARPAAPAGGGAGGAHRIGGRQPTTTWESSWPSRPRAMRWPLSGRPGRDPGARAGGVLGHPRPRPARDRLRRRLQALGYEIDAYSIQHEMSTHYGRMVATDDALMLFSDPTEAMEHLLS